MIITTIIYTLFTHREISIRFPVFLRFINRFILDRLQHIKYHNKSVFSLYCGKQGCGKTYALVAECDRLLKSGQYTHIISNVPIAFDDKQITVAKTVDDFVYLAQDQEQTIFVIDEIQSFVDSFKTPDDFYYLFCTLRKRNCIMLATSQVFDRVSVKLREQVNQIIYCRTYFGCLSLQKVYAEIELNNDKKIKADNLLSVILSEKKWGVQSEKIRSLYDTYSY